LNDLTPFIGNLGLNNMVANWQAVVGLDDGELLLERPKDEPFPVIEVRESLPDGTEFKAVWSLVKDVPLARLVTVHFFD
jgi:hypothetical protein